MTTSWSTPPEPLSDSRSRCPSSALACFAHAHVLRVLAARWLGLDPRDGRLFVLGTGCYGVLGFERETPVILRWGLT